MEPFAIGLYLVGVLLLALTFFPFSPMTLKFWMPKRETMLFAHQHRVLLRGLGSLSVAITFFLAMTGDVATEWGWVAGLTGVFFLAFWWGGYVPVIMGSPQDQQLLSAEQAETILKPQDDVLGVVLDGEAHAYPRMAITRPHLYHDTIGGIPITVTYCILCNSGVALRAELEGQPLSLHPITAFNNNIIYYDAQSGNYIQQLEGDVIAGPAKGKRLATLPTTLTTWRTWKELYPRTRVLFAPETKLRDRMLTNMLHWMMPLAGLMQRRTPWHPLNVNGNRDERLPAMTPIFGVEVKRERKAYPLSLLRNRKVVNDALDGVPIVILYDPARDTGGVFTREVDGRVLTFRAFANGVSQIVAMDEETRSLWDVRGKACEGVSAGTGLSPVPHFGKVFWFSWATFRPGTRLETEVAGGH
ncbi:MAG TPA: DUF3179 domain-containing (seleno)protein [Methylomirabilota bacterium]|jgi:hypothetical protein|nr:DUF3179 domain-containing (seleno)protein [Methylomirabilota bacterium]